MRHYLLKLSLGLFVSILVACNANEFKEKQSHLQAKKERQLKKKHELSQQLDATWISASYLKRIAESKSIYKDRKYDTKIFGFTLELKNLLGATPFLSGFTDHEGGYDSPLRYNSKKARFENDLKHLEEFAFFQEPFELKLIDPEHLEMYFVDENRKDLFYKTKNMHDVFRKILFVGSYRELKNGKLWRFKENGSFTGHTPDGHYQLLFDFGEGLDFDVVQFFIPGKESESTLFHYKIEMDTLYLFEINGEIPEYRIGKLRYELVKTSH